MLRLGPLDVPTNLRIRPNTKNSTYAEFIWDEVDTSVERVRGFFRGYRVKKPYRLHLFYCDSRLKDRLHYARIRVLMDCTPGGSLIFTIALYCVLWA